MTEKQLLAGVLELASWTGWLAYHTHDSRHSAAGFPDLCLVRGRRLLFAELKAARGRVSDAQRTWIAALQGAGCDVRLWRPADWPEIEATLCRDRLTEGPS